MKQTSAAYSKTLSIEDKLIIGILLIKAKKKNFLEWLKNIPFYCEMIGHIILFEWTLDLTTTNLGGQDSIIEHSISFIIQSIIQRIWKPLSSRQKVVL